MITIRKANLADLPVIVDFQISMARETENLSLEPDVVRSGVVAVMNDPSKGFYMVAEKHQQVIASLLITPEWSDWRNGTFLWIQSLYVLPEYRKQGIFRSMFAFIRSMVENTPEYIGLRLYVDQENLPAQHVYWKVGMKASHYQLFEWKESD